MNFKKIFVFKEKEVISTYKGQDDYVIKGTINTWVFDKLIENPDLYGGDNGNAAIQLQYIIEMNQGKRVDVLTLETFKHSTAVSRAKNDLLKRYPEFDRRVKNKPKDEGTVA